MSNENKQLVVDLFERGMSPRQIQNSNVLPGIKGSTITTIINEYLKVGNKVVTIEERHEYVKNLEAKCHSMAMWFQLNPKLKGTIEYMKKEKTLDNLLEQLEDENK